MSDLIISLETSMFFAVNSRFILQSNFRNSIIQLSQNIRNYILSLNWNPLLANLYERTVEVHFSAISYNLNHPRVTPSEVDEV